MTVDQPSDVRSRRPRIVDFSTHLSGPIASSLLREAGAEVIKVENPNTGDGLRPSLPKIHGEAIAHVGVNSGARSLAIDSRAPQWNEVVGACARWADAVIVGNRPTEARARHLDFATLKQHSPNLIYLLDLRLRRSRPVERMAGPRPEPGCDGRGVAGRVGGWHATDP